MPPRTLTPVFVGLRTGLHLLVATLLALVVVRVINVHDAMWTGLLLCVGFAIVYAAGGYVTRGAGAHRRGWGVLWLLLLSSFWAALLAFVPEASYLAFPLFFLFLHMLPGAAGIITVAAATAVTIVALGVHGGFTVAGVVGPIVGAGVAVLISLGYRALSRESAEREALLAELMLTRDELAATERDRGKLEERGRLAREIHDTVAQGLASIQMLLHAAESAAPDGPGIEHIRLARATAADSLADTRRFIRELSPPRLDAGLAAALQRLGAQWCDKGVPVQVTTPTDEQPMSMDTQTALFRIAQGAVANAAQHAQASCIHVRLNITSGTVSLSVEDDGRGFDLEDARRHAGVSNSFGLQAMRDRIDQLNGRLVITTTVGVGTRIEALLKAGPS